MSRIRSIHPGLFTDEDYMALSFPARELIKGLWVEADDHGVFEWKLLTIKARIMPADVVDMAALMSELVDHHFIRQFDFGEKRYGAVRNFCRYQRPKKPTYPFPLPDDIAAYVAAERKPSGTEGSSHDDGGEPDGDELDSGGEPVPHQFGTGPVKCPQREVYKEEEGKKGRKVPTSSGDGAPVDGELPLPTRAASPPALPAQAVSPADVIFGQCLPLLTRQGTPERQARSLLGKWRKQYGDGRVIDVLTRAQTMAPSEIVGWAEKALRASPSGHGRGGYPPPPVEDVLAETDRLYRQWGVQ